MTDAGIIAAIERHERRLLSFATAAERLSRVTVDADQRRELEDVARAARGILKVSRDRTARGELTRAVRLVRDAAGRVRWDRLSVIDTPAVRA